MPRNTELFGPTFHGEGIVRLDNVKLDPRYGKNVPYHGMPEGHLPVVSYLAVPVISQRGEVLGGLFFGHSEESVFTDREERMVVGLAAQAAITIDNAQLYRHVQAERERFRVTLASIGDAVIATNLSGVITFINVVAQTLTGWSETDAIGMQIEEVFHIVSEESHTPVESPVSKVQVA
jgi:GAF domain-containing protein